MLADFPKDRLKEAPLFTCCTIDMFGPFTVSVKRSDMKRYGVMLICLASRAIHIEVTYSLETNSFIQALRRLIAQRGSVRQICSENRSNFVGAEQKLLKAFSEIEDRKLLPRPLRRLDYLEKKLTSSQPLECLMSAGAILNCLLQAHKHSWHKVSLQTLMIGAEAIIDSQSLTVEAIND